MRVLSRMWQMLLKGITEVQAATRPAAAAEMVLVRIAYVADMPTPDEAIRMLDQSGGASPMIAVWARACGVRRPRRHRRFSRPLLPHRRGRTPRRVPARNCPRARR